MKTIFYGAKKPIALQGIQKFIILITLSSCFHQVCAQVIFSSPEDAVVFARQNAKEKTVEKELILSNLRKSKAGIQDYLPVFDVSFSESNLITFNGPDSRTKKLQFGLNQKLFDGTRKMNYELSNIQALYAFKENQLSAKQFESEIISDYYNFLIARKESEIQSELLDKTLAEKLVIEKKFELGMIIESDYLEFLTSVLKIQNQKEDSERNCKIQERILKLSAGIEEKAELHIEDSLPPTAIKTPLEQYIETLWNIVRKNSITLQQEDISLIYARKQQKYSETWYLPVISVKPSVNFSGEDFPLSSPAYSVQLSIGFENIPFAPISVSNNYNFSQKKLTGISNSAESYLPNDITGMISRNNSRLSILQQQIKREKNEKQLYSTLYEQIITHDNFLRTIEILENTKNLQEMRLSFAKLQMDQGSIKPADYLEQLIDFANTKISLLKSIINAASAERTLSILCGLPFKELINVCK